MRLLGFTGGGKTKPVPYYGKIHAGEPSLLPEHREGYITMDRRFIPTEEVFFLKVKGDSMIGRSISDGDYVMVNPAAKPKENDIVAARIGDEATVKTLTHSNGKVVLEPANPSEREIVLNENDDYSILGVLCGVFRPFVTMEAMTAAQTEAETALSLASSAKTSPEQPAVDLPAVFCCPRCSRSSPRSARAPSARECSSPPS